MKSYNVMYTHYKVVFNSVSVQDVRWGRRSSTAPLL